MRIAWAMLLVLCAAVAANADVAASAPAVGAVGDKPAGWWAPTVGSGNGDWEVSLGAHAWKDRFRLRNLIAQAGVDLGPGLRAHVLARHNREVDTLSGFRPNLDEAYLEAFAFHTAPSATAAASLRVGRLRYLRFPYPDAIAMFEQVPGVSDLQDGAHTGYSGAVVAAEYAHRAGWGAHFTGILWGFDRSGANVIEDYAFLRRDLGALRVEARAGGIASRVEPLGTSPARGYDLYAGLNHRGYSAGVLYEKRERQPAYTGVVVTLASSALSRAAGGVALDYTRASEGLSVQVPVAHGDFGFASRPAAASGGPEPVGEIVAVRERTWWQAGLVRNYYEHPVSAWGITDDPTLVVTKEQYPYYLWAEALVSPHTKLDSQWFHDRQGPAHVTAVIVYRFYRPSAQ